MLTHPRPRIDPTNPYERPEPPRCPKCDEFMEERRVRFAPNWYECVNPECEECAERIKENELSSLQD